MTATDVGVDLPLLTEPCRTLGRHWITYDGQALCDCRKQAVPVEGDVDDLGDTVLAQTVLRRDKYGRVIQ